MMGRYAKLQPMCAVEDCKKKKGRKVQLKTFFGTSIELVCTISLEETISMIGKW